MKFEWDAAKAKRTEALHDVPFEYATSVFLDEHRLTWRDARKDYGETRYVTHGIIEGRLYVVVYTPRAQAIRIISARKGNAREQKNYNKNSLHA